LAQAGVGLALSVCCDSGDYLSLAVWPGKSDPEDEVISVQVRRMEGEWKTVGRLAVYRTKEGVYSQLPETKGAEKVLVTLRLTGLGC
jgi:hypothetical protein